MTKYIGSGGDVVIPDGVTSIDDYTFWTYKNLTIHASANSYAKDYAIKKIAVEGEELVKILRSRVNSYNQAVEKKRRVL